MKNNKGFAITGIIYGLMVIFVFILSSFLAVVVGKNKRSEELLKSVYEDIEVKVFNVYSSGTKKVDVQKFDNNLKYITKERAKYVFYSDTDEENSCGEVYLPKGIEIEINTDGKAVYNSDKVIGNCSYTNWDINIINISVNGTISSSGIPKTGLYSMTSDCSNLSYNPFTKELKIKGGDIPITCEVNFTPYSNSNYPLLNTMKVGDYVAYVGNNGCSDEECSGQNIEYEATFSNERLIYGGRYYTLYHTSGWRIAYIKDGNVYLITAGSPQSISYTSGTRAYILVDRLNGAALKYCNSTYVDGGSCSKSNTWAMGNDDFKNITNSNLTSEYGSPYCQDVRSTKRCGYNNDLIDIGGSYWFAAYASLTYKQGALIWSSSNRSVFGGDDSNTLFTTSTGGRGVRPIVKLSSSVYVTGGSGTVDDPYLIGI